jgi:Zn ribbon nucleic-acid-binding protein
MKATVRVLATDCPNCRAENVANLASEHQTGLKINPPDQTTCVKCGHVYVTDYLYLRQKTDAEMNAIGGTSAFAYRL